MIIRVDSLVPRCGDTHPLPEWDASWRIALLTDASDYTAFCGRGERGAYTLKISRTNCDWRMAVGDFISHAEAEQKHALLVMSAGELESSKRAYQGHAHNDPFLRPREPDVLIHSTPMEHYAHILRDGCLKSWNLVRQARQTCEIVPIGHALGDPEDFRDYIMFGTGVTGEIVVSSKQAGGIVMDTGAPYLSGARLYFDAQLMAQRGLLARDGAHIKVKDRLPLSPYLLFAATWETLGLSGRRTTPAAFAAAADSAFLARFPERRLVP